jgi:hypothetical protein
VKSAGDDGKTTSRDVKDVIDPSKFLFSKSACGIFMYTALMVF